MWHALRAFGFVYYAVYSTTTGAGPICWITRETMADRYVIFYCDGWHKASSTRGSIVNAKALASEYIASYNKS